MWYTVVRAVQKAVLSPKGAGGPRSATELNKYDTQKYQTKLNMPTASLQWEKLILITLSFKMCNKEPKLIKISSNTQYPTWRGGGGATEKLLFTVHLITLYYLSNASRSVLL